MDSNSRGRIQRLKIPSGIPPPITADMPSNHAVGSAGHSVGSGHPMGSATSSQRGGYVENRVWVSHPSLGFAPGRIIREVSKDQVELEAYDGYREIVPKQNCSTIHRNSLGGIANLLDLGEFTMAALLHNVRTRYERGEFYSSIGLPILISVNPYKPMPHLYDASTRRKYQSAQFLLQSPASSSAQSSRSPVPRQRNTRVPQTQQQPDEVTALADRKLFIDHPHLFGTAQMTYGALIRNRQAQSVVISGESGAGKTEATKILLRYFSELEDGIQSPRNDISVEQHTIRSNPILEAFGNAKTVRNDNSSRFGKFIQIYFDLKSPKRVRSARISHYLLEKCRLVSLHPGERNFHVFYCLLLGANDEFKRKMRFWDLDIDQDLRHFPTMLGATEDDWFVGNEAEQFDELLTCLPTTGFSESDIEGMFTTVAALLHLSNIHFTVRDDPSVSYTTGARLCDIVDERPLKIVEKLLRLQNNANLPTASSIQDVLLYKAVRNAEGVGSFIKSGRDLNQACQVRDSIIKEIYSRMFSWIVKRINKALCAKDGAVEPPRAKMGAKALGRLGTDSGVGGRGDVGARRGLQQCTPPIGLLDIYGFEVFEGRNSFEQLCINYANEKLQQHFNMHMLAFEQKTYKQENIDWSEIKFTDNSNIIAALEEPPHGIFVILDETRVTDKNRDKLFLTQIDRLAKRDVVKLPPLKAFRSNAFTVEHYAGAVEYESENFVDKNQDKLELHCTHFLSVASTSSFIKELFPVDEFNDLTRRNNIRATLSLEFRQQLDCLLQSLTATIPTYVRCIKPNGNKEPNRFDSLEALRQLKYAGLLESIRIRNSGFGVRCSFTEFLQEYALLDAAIFVAWRRGAENLKEMATHVLRSNVGESKGAWQIGKTKVFMKEEVQLHLERCRANQRVFLATCIQAAWRGYLARTHFYRVREIVIRCQSYYRRKLAMRFADQMRGALRIQNYWLKTRPLRRRLLNIIRAAIVFQRAWRQKQERRKLRSKVSMPRQETEAETATAKSFISDSPANAPTTESLPLVHQERPASVRKAPPPAKLMTVPSPLPRSAEPAGLVVSRVLRRRRRTSVAPTTTSVENSVAATFVKDLRKTLQRAQRENEACKVKLSEAKRQLKKREEMLSSQMSDMHRELARREEIMDGLLCEKESLVADVTQLSYRVNLLRELALQFESVASQMYEFVEDPSFARVQCKSTLRSLQFMRQACSQARAALCRFDTFLQTPTTDLLIMAQHDHENDFDFYSRPAVSDVYYDYQVPLPYDYAEYDRHVCQMSSPSPFDDAPNDVAAWARPRQHYSVASSSHGIADLPDMSKTHHFPDYPHGSRSTAQHSFDYTRPPDYSRASPTGAPEFSRPPPVDYPRGPPLADYAGYPRNAYARVPDYGARPTPEYTRSSEYTRSRDFSEYRRSSDPRNSEIVPALSSYGLEGFGRRSAPWPASSKRPGMYMAVEDTTRSAGHQRGTSLSTEGQLTYRTTNGGGMPLGRPPKISSRGMTTRVSKVGTNSPEVMSRTGSSTSSAIVGRRKHTGNSPSPYLQVGGRSLPSGARMENAERHGSANPQGDCCSGSDSPQLTSRW